MYRILGGLALTVSAVFAIALIVGTIAGSSMLGPFLVMWTLTVLPMAFIPQWIHPRIRTRRDRRDYRTVAIMFMVTTWLAITALNAVTPTWSFLVWFATEAAFVTMIVHSIRLRIRVAKLNHSMDRAGEFTDLDREFAAYLKGNI